MNRETIRPLLAPSRAELARRANAALERAAALAGRGLERHAADFGLTDAKLELMEVLGGCDEHRCCLYDIGDRLGVTRPNVTKLVDGLQRNGLVERLPHPADGRKIQAHLTGDGCRLADSALPGRERRMHEFWDRLEDSEIDHLLELLERLTGDEPAPAGA